MATEPTCTEVTVSASVGGKVQIVKFEFTSDYHYSMSRKYSVPEDWTQDDVEAFQTKSTIDLREQVEQLAQAELDELMDQRDKANG